jgi:tryptophan halogenase
VDWHQRREDYFHPFGVLGNPIDSQDFYQCWLKARSMGDTSSLQDFSPCNVMAEHGRFFLPEQARNTPIGGANYALHVDAKKLAEYLRSYSQARGVICTEGKVTQVQQGENGFIKQLILEDGRQIDGDFFIDCSGFRSLLIDKTLGVPFTDWSEYLPCDRAIAVKTEAKGPTLNYTLATARKSGWTWRIPLRDTVGHGYVYSSQFCSDQEAKTTLMRSLDGSIIDEPRYIPFVAGHRQEIWKNNCLAVGLSSGFIEPLESTAIHLIARGIEFFLRYLPDRECAPALIREYNRRMTADYEEVRDFIVLHYSATARTDTPFWQWCQNITIPDSLKERIELFQAHGTLRQGVDELFRSTSWQSVFEGMGLRPAKYNPRVNNIDPQEIKRTMHLAKNAITGMVKNLPTHDEFLGSR